MVFALNFTLVSYKPLPKSPQKVSSMYTNSVWLKSQCKSPVDYKYGTPPLLKIWNIVNLEYILNQI